MRNKKIMIIVPHEDDELIVAGGFLHSEYVNNKNVWVVFATDGNFTASRIRRRSEAIRSTRFLGIPQEHVIFLGYDDVPPEAKMHHYHEHKSQELNSLTVDLAKVIEKYCPDVLMTIDFDSHPDHRAVALSFDKAMGQILKHKSNYWPIILKTFAYPTAYKGVRDFSDVNLRSTRYKRERNALGGMQNPYYKWDERVRLPVGEGARKRFLLFNKMYWNIRKHRSQVALLRNTFAIINGDQIFWQRRTDNLALDAKIKVSSGDAKCLNDFMLMDAESILGGDTKKPRLANISWMPDKQDNEKTIEFNFAQAKKIESVRLYQNILSRGRVKTIFVEFGDLRQEFELADDLVSEIFLPKTLAAKKLKISVIETTDEADDAIRAGFVEVEIFAPIESQSLFCQPVVDGDFAYDKYYFKGKKPKEQMYIYDGYRSRYLDTDGINTEKKVRILKLNVWRNGVICFVNVVNNLVLSVDIFYARVMNKICRVLGRM